MPGQFLNSKSISLQISANASLADVVQVESCFVSPQSDPKKSPFWTVVSDGCSSDPSVRLGAKAGGDEDEDAYAEEEEDVGREEDRNGHSGRRFSPIDNSSPNVGDSEKAQLLRFSFVLRPIYNESMQFVHCTLRLCLSDSAREETTQEARSCQSGVPIPPLVPGSSRHQVKKHRIKFLMGVDDVNSFITNCDLTVQYFNGTIVITIKATIRTIDCFCRCHNNTSKYRDKTLRLYHPPLFKLFLYNLIF